MSPFRAGRKLFYSIILALALTPIGFGQGGASIEGVVRDADGSAIGQVTVSLLNARQTVLLTAQTDGDGRFALRGVVPPGSYELLISGGRGFALKRVPVKVTTGGVAPVEITLGLAGLTAEVTVTAEIGTVQALDQTSQQVNVIEEGELGQRARAVTAQIAQDEPGLQLQRTSPTIGAIFVRGLTGAKVVSYIDGIRFSNAAARGGINSFFNLNDISNLRAVEVIRGPNSAQYGSDSLGGSVQMISRVPLFASAGREVHGQFGQQYNSADHSFGGHALIALGGRRFALLVSTAGHRSNTVRPGGGFESHSAVNRFFGLRSDLVFGERSTDTAFSQYGGLVKLAYRLTELDQLTLHYQRGQIDGGKRFDQTIGGDGNLVADLRNFMLDFFYGRYERYKAGWFDSVAASYSYNAQREERVNQGGNGNPLGVITYQPERTVVSGLQFQAAKQWERGSLVAGGDYYGDRISSPSHSLDPTTLIFTPARPRVPDGARYDSFGLYAQQITVAVPERLRLIGAIRYGRSSYRSDAASSPLVGGGRLWPDDRLTAGAITPRVGTVVTLTERVYISAQVSRGFRTPSITDLGTLGLTGNGYEANAVDLSGRGATLGTTGGSDAVSTGIPVAPLKPETSWSYEAGIHFHRQRVDFDLNAFINDINDNIVLQTLILPAGAVGVRLGEQVITAQSTTGAVFVAAATNPVLIRANYGDSRTRGIEQRFDLKLGRDWTLAQNFTWLRSADKLTGLPPTIEGGTPAPQGNLRLRYDQPGGQLWIEPYLYAADRQSRLSTLDLDDRRSGARRSRTSIQNFFRRGAAARGLVAAGPDARLGTADDTLIATGETLAQVQNRVLGAAVSAPLFPYIPGFVTFGLRGGVKLGAAHQIFFDLENLNDRNYRGISWGMDAPGRSFGLRYRYQF